MKTQTAQLLLLLGLIAPLGACDANEGGEQVEEQQPGATTEETQSPPTPAATEGGTTAPTVPAEDEGGEGGEG